MLEIVHIGAHKSNSIFITNDLFVSGFSSNIYVPAKNIFLNGFNKNYFYIFYWNIKQILHNNNIEYKIDLYPLPSPTIKSQLTNPLKKYDASFWLELMMSYLIYTFAIQYTIYCIVWSYGANGPIKLLHFTMDITSHYIFNVSNYIHFVVYDMIYDEKSSNIPFTASIVLRISIYSYMKHCVNLSPLGILHYLVISSRIFIPHYYK